MDKVSIQIASLCFVVCSGCASNTATGRLQLEPGMTANEVRDLLGDPDDRSFRQQDEAWQYFDVVGFGQCEYMTVWLSEDTLHAVTTRRGSSVAGCGLGSSPVDWGQMPSDAEIDINVTVQDGQ